MCKAAPFAKTHVDATSLPEQSAAARNLDVVFRAHGNVHSIIDCVRDEIE
jgi:hypothetical protein